MSKERWKCALIGAAICGIVGPPIGVILVNVVFIRPSSIRVASQLFFKEWAVACVGFGPPALLLGGIGAVVLQGLIRQGRFKKKVMLQTAALGMTLGSAVPVIFNVVFAAIDRKEYNIKDDLLLVLPIAAMTGVVCEFLVLWIFYLTNVLRHPSSTAKV